jgi:hypothetical protein
VKNKLRVIDVSILSTYMGRALTVFVTLFVVGIAASAIIGGGFERNVIRVCVPVEARPGEAVENFEPLRALLARETHRPVTLVECAGEWPSGMDLYVMPIGEYFRRERELEVKAIFEAAASEAPNDRAVVIARQSTAPSDVESLTVRDVVFVGPASVNGFWVQADALEPEGQPGDPSRFVFEGASNDATRVICGVALGVFKFGACKLSEVSELSRRGVIEPRELRVVGSRGALPETVIAVRRREERYFLAKIGRIAALIGDGSPSAHERESVRLLGSAGVRRLDRLDTARVGEVRRLFDRFDAVSRSAGRETAGQRPAPGL